MYREKYFLVKATLAKIWLLTNTQAVISDVLDSS